MASDELIVSGGKGKFSKGEIKALHNDIQKELANLTALQAKLKSANIDNLKSHNEYVKEREKLNKQESSERKRDLAVEIANNKIEEGMSKKEIERRKKELDRLQKQYELEEELAKQNREFEEEELSEKKKLLEKSLTVEERSYILQEKEYEQAKDNLDKAQEHNDNIQTLRTKELSSLEGTFAEPAIKLIEGLQTVRDRMSDTTSSLSENFKSLTKPIQDVKKAFRMITGGVDKGAKLSAADKEKSLEKKGFIGEKVSKAGGAIKDAAAAPIGNVMDMMKGIMAGGFMLVALKYINEFLNSDTFKTIIQTIKEKVMPALKTIWEKVIKPLAMFLFPILVDVFLLIVDAVVLIVDAVIGIGKFLADLGTWWYDMTIGNIMKLFDGESSSGDIVAALVDLMTFVPNLLKDWLYVPILEFFGMDTSKGLGKDLKDLSIGELFVKYVWDPIVEMFTFKGKSDFNLGKFIDKMFKKVVKWLGKTFGFDTKWVDDFSLSEWIDETFRDIVKAVGEFFGFDTSAITSDFSIIDWISDTISGLWDTIRGYFGYGPKAIKGDASFMERVGMMLSDFFSGIFYTILTFLGEKLGSFGGKKILEFAEEFKPKKRETGGSVSAGQLVMVGESGPELMSTGQPGTVYTAQRTQSMLDGALNKKAETQQTAAAAPAINNIITDNSTQSSSGFVSPVEMIINDKLFRAAHSYTC